MSAIVTDKASRRNFQQALQFVVGVALRWAEHHECTDKERPTVGSENPYAPPNVSEVREPMSRELSDRSQVLIGLGLVFLVLYLAAMIG